MMASNGENLPKEYSLDLCITIIELVKHTTIGAIQLV